jgi:hypothetical protein
MKYSKPHVVEVGSAVKVIESNLEKIDCVLDSPKPSTSCAYETDE